MTDRPRFGIEQTHTLRGIVVNELVEKTEKMISMPKRHNTIYGYEDFICGVVEATHRNKSVGKVANTRRSKYEDVRGAPTDEWYRLKIKDLKFECVDETIPICMCNNIN